MSKRMIGLILAVLGIVSLLIFLGADMIGIGTYPGYNGFQTGGMILFGIVSIVGVVLVFITRKKKK